MAPYTSSSILPLLTSSAQAAAKACNGNVCPEAWATTISTNGTSSLGDQISALSVVQGLLVKGAAVPVTAGSANETSSGTSTATGSSSTPGSTASGTPRATSTNSAFGVGGEDAKMAVLAAGLGSLAWLML